MKKYLLVAVLFLLLPMMVLGDSAGPSILGYDAVIINKNGAKDICDCYDNCNENQTSNYVIPYNTKVHVLNGYICDDGREVADVEIKISSDDTENYRVNLKDIMPLKSEITLDDIKISDSDWGMDGRSDSLEIIVFEKNGLKLSKGPAGIYGTYDEIVPYMTRLKSSYALYSYKNGGWFYINDGKYHGWIDTTYHSQNNVVVETESFLLMTETKMVDENRNVIETIPAETILNHIYSVSNHGNGKNIEYDYFVQYNGKEGYIGVHKYDGSKWTTLYNVNYSEKVAGYLVSIKDTKLTSIDGKERIKIPVGEKVRILYAQGFDDEHSDSIQPVCIEECYYYLEYKGVKGYISSDDAYSLPIDSKQITLSLKEDTYMYKIDMFPVEIDNYYDNKKKYKTNIIVPANTSIVAFEEVNYFIAYDEDGVPITEQLYLVNYNGNVGYIIPNSERIIKKDVKVDENEKKDNQITPPINNTIKPYVKNKSSKDTIIYGVVAGVVLAIVSIVTIFLVNSKKKKSTSKTEESAKKDIEKDSKTVKVEDEKVQIKDDIAVIPKKKKNGKRNVTIKKEKEFKKKN